jgi:hypothetical protein
MPAEITQENVRLLLPGKNAQVASMIAEAKKIPSAAALLEFYHSETYRKLECEKTKYWYFSPSQLFELYLQQG